MTLSLTHPPATLIVVLRFLSATTSFNKSQICCSCGVSSIDTFNFFRESDMLTEKRNKEKRRRKKMRKEEKKKEEKKKEEKKI